MIESGSLSRRQLLSLAAGITAGGATQIAQAGAHAGGRSRADTAKSVKVRAVGSEFEREPLIRPFGFKGGFMTESWQSAAMMESESGIRKIGLCTQSVLWSDSEVFASHSEAGGNALMFAITERALQMVRGTSFRNPVELLEHILPELHEYGKKITANPHLRKTFILNSLVGVDNAAWLLYSGENGIANFDDMIPAAYRPAFSNKHRQLASIPLMAYTIPIDEITQAVQQGYFFMKIKIGQPGTQEEMLEKDMARVQAIHKAIGSRTTPRTRSGKIPYYFDANGRYEKKETLQKLLDHIRKIGAFEQIAVIEEPFPEELDVRVDDLGVRIAADESAHTDEDAIRRIELGYRAIAVKAIAKTLSMTMKIARVAHERKIPCFCADLTVNPILVDWNKNVAARLSAFPDLGVGLLETNGHQNYRNWARMVSWHPCAGAPWTQTRDGVFELDEDFYRRSGGIFMPSPHYQSMFK